jgi:hypothetical protein
MPALIHYNTPRPIKSSVPDPQNRLPEDLEREIIELTARCFPGFAPTLALVSKQAQAWVERIIYNTVILDYPLKTPLLFLRTIESRPASFFASHVKNLYITSMVPYPHAQRALSVCTSVVSLTCWTDAGPQKRGIFPPLISKKNLKPFHRLERLSVDLDSVIGTDFCSGHPVSFSLHSIFQHHVFKHVTHLEVVNPPGGRSTGEWDSLLDLPSLTHLALGTLYSSHVSLIPSLVTLLEESETLNVLVLITVDATFIDHLKAKEIRDPRLVVMRRFHEGLGVREYWRAVRKNERTFWSLPEALVGRMMQEGSVDPMCV